MFPNISTGGKIAAYFFLFVAALLVYMGFRFNYTHGDGGPNFYAAGGVAVMAWLIAYVDNRRHTK